MKKLFVFNLLIRDVFSRLVYVQGIVKQLSDLQSPGISFFFRV